jgi:Phage integrase family
VRSLFQAAGRLVEKDTKTHAARWLALSDDSVVLLDEHKRRCADRADACGVRLSDDAYVFSFDPAGRQPMHPDSVTHRFSRLAKQLGLRTRLHDLRHYAATQLIAGGVDLRTVSGRIGQPAGEQPRSGSTRIFWRRPTDKPLRYSRRHSDDPAGVAPRARHEYHLWAADGCRVKACRCRSWPGEAASTWPLRC